jgi:hypothetical protein
MGTIGTGYGCCKLLGFFEVCGSLLGADGCTLVLACQAEGFMALLSGAFKVY